jgi:BirA family biotin operon repressor/biotin-[acetyl-CoA-carboxylase] ligase
MLLKNILNQQDFQKYITGSLWGNPQAVTDKPGESRLLNEYVYHYKKVDSTNNIAYQLADAGVPEGTIVISEEQSAGKGRLKRNWLSPPSAGLFLSLVFRPPLEPAHIPQLTLLSGVAVNEAIEAVAHCRSGIKWPNDILINGKKVCGILAESKLANKGNSGFVVVGIGINVNMDYAGFPAELKDTAISLKIAAGQEVCRLQLVKALLTALDRHYINFLKHGYPYLRQEWLNANITIGRTVKITKSEGKGDTVEGKAVDISQTGGLIVQFPDGRQEEFLAGDVTIGTANIIDH